MDDTLRQRFDGAGLSEIPNLNLRIERVVEGTMAGLHRSLHRGSSIEFSEHREYAPGDDFRRLDWKAYARLDKFYVREYEDETELRAYLVLDCSGSMGYGKPMHKLDFGTVFAGALAHILARQGDRAALLTFSEKVIDYLPAQSRIDRLHSLFSLLSGVQPQKTTNIANALHFLNDRITPRSLLVVISDFFDHEEKALSALAHYSSRAHHVWLVHLLHDDELNFPFKRTALFKGMESALSLIIDPDMIKKTYLEAMKRFCDSMRDRCLEHRIRYIPLSTGDALDKALIELLRGRSKINR